MLHLRLCNCVWFDTGTTHNVQRWRVSTAYPIVITLELRWRKRGITMERTVPKGDVSKVSIAVEFGSRDPSWIVSFISMY